MTELTWHGLNEQTVLRFADVLSVSKDANNATITLSVGDCKTGEIFCTNCLLYNAPGIYSLPLPTGTVSNGQFTPAATAQIGSKVLCFQRCDYWTAFATIDQRTQSNPGNVQPGEICVQAIGGEGRILLKNDDSINLYTLNNGSSLGLFINPASDTISCINSMGYGLQITDNGLTLTAATSSPAGGGLNIDTSGDVSLIATGQNQIDGSSIVLGSLAEPGDNTVMINPTALISVLSSINLSLTAFVAAVSAFTGTGTFPGLVAVSTSIEELTVQISGLEELISSQKVVAQ